MKKSTRAINYFLFALYIFIITITQICVEGEIEILLDTRTALSDLGWTMSAGSEWQEMTSSDASGNERRMLMVCEIRKANQDNWMRSQYINVRGAERIYVEIEFTIRSCEDVPNVATCKETFHLFYYETDRDEATSTFPPWNEETYTKVDTIAADQRFQPGSSNTNFETRDIGPIKKSGLYLAVQDTGACVAIMHIRVYYKYCAGNTTNLATFAKTKTGPDVTSLVEAKGSCVRNAVTEQNSPRPSLYCNGEGKWTVPSGTCACTAGYEPNRQRTQCITCQPGLYKSSVANHRCKRCPDYSSSIVAGSTICECMEGYFRSHTDTANHQCTKPPTKAVKLYTSVNKTTVTLSWNSPLNTGGRGDLSYEVQCMRCQSYFDDCHTCNELIRYSPSVVNLKSTHVTIFSLSSYAFYKFKICAVNGVTEVARSRGNPLNNCAESAIETNQAAPSAVDGLRTLQITESSFILAWEPPFKPNGKILNYQVSVSHVEDDASSEKTANQEAYRLNSTTERKMKITGLDSGTVYMAKVRAWTIAGYGPYSIPIRVKLFNPTASPDIDGDKAIATNSSIDIVHLVLIAAGSLSFIILLAALIYLYRRRKMQKIDKKKIDQEKPGAIYNGANVHFVRNVMSRVHKTYVDPTTYEDPDRAVREFTKEINSSFVKIEEVIGGGEFGEVCKGKLQLPKSEQNVAIKTLKSGYSTQQKLDFLGEASIMGQFDHPNVIRLEGVVTRSRPLMIITEYMENGSLDTYLRRHDNQLTVIQLVGMLRNIGSGMSYLSEMGYVHRDLAARNILVDSKLVCKVSDFGMSRVLEEDDGAAYTTRGGKIPIRWTAPEAITFRKFTFASDVWSYGIVMWEVMSFGERPYWGMSNQDVMNAIDNGYRLPAPMDCPQAQHKLMLECWKKERNKRPKFNQIVSALDNMLKEPAQLKVKVNNRVNMAVPTTNIIPGRPSSTVPPGSGKVPLLDAALSSAPVTNGHASSFIVPNGHSSIFINDQETEETPMLRVHDEETTSDGQSDIKSIRTWLGSLGLSHYNDKFIQSGRTNMEQVAKMEARSSNYDMIYSRFRSVEQWNVQIVDSGTTQPERLKLLAVVSDLIKMGIADQSQQEVLLKSICDISQKNKDRVVALPSYAESNLTYSGISV